MTPDQLAEIIRGGETLDVEFKGEEKTPLSDDDLVEAIVCLANRTSQQSGWLLIGVEDDGRITGARPRHEAGITDPKRLQGLIANRTRPSLSCRVELLSIDDKTVIAIEVPPWRSPVATSAGSYFRRMIGGRGRPECVPFYFHEMQSLQASRGLLDVSALVVPEASWEDLDPLEFERFRRTIRESSGRADASLLNLPDAELARALGAVEGPPESPAVRLLGLLLFGKADRLPPLVPAHEAAFQVLAGTKVEVNEFFRWPLLRVMDELLSRFAARNKEEEVMHGMLRIGVPDYPERAFREGLANALIHRDYTRLGAVHVQWHSDRIEISSPGGFPEGVSIENILVTPPRPRSPLLADAFKRAGIVERTARGIDTIFYEQLRSGRPAPSYERSTSSDVVLVLPGGPANLNFVRLVAEETRAGRLLTLDDLLILNRMWIERALVTTDAASLIQKPEAEARAVLQRLVEAGLVEPRGVRKGRQYHLSAATYRRLGEKAAYVRQRGFEPLQQEQMVLQYAEKHGAITRGEAAGLCHLSLPQAYRLLQSLAKKGLLLKVGKRGRSVKYKKKGT